MERDIKMTFFYRLGLVFLRWFVRFVNKKQKLTLKSLSFIVSGSVDQFLHLLLSQPQVSEQHREFLRQPHTLVMHNPLHLHFVPAVRRRWINNNVALFWNFYGTLFCWDFREFVPSPSASGNAYKEPPGAKSGSLLRSSLGVWVISFAFGVSKMREYSAFVKWVRLVAFDFEAVGFGRSIGFSYVTSMESSSEEYGYSSSDVPSLTNLSATISSCYKKFSVVVEF